MLSKFFLLLLYTFFINVFFSYLFVCLFLLERMKIKWKMKADFLFRFRVKMKKEVKRKWIEIGIFSLADKVFFSYLNRKKNQKINYRQFFVCFVHQISNHPKYIFFVCVCVFVSKKYECEFLIIFFIFFCIFQFLIILNHSKYLFFFLIFSSS